MVIDIEQLKKQRISLDLTQKDLAKLSGVSQSLIAKIESKKIDPTYSKIKRISDTIFNLKNLNSKKAKDIMRTKIESINYEDDIDDAINLMKQKGYSQVGVKKNGEIIGLVCERSLIDYTIYKDKKIDNYIEYPNIINEDTSLNTIRTILKEENALFVSRKSKIIGIITRTDII